jgi:2,3-bisphosphoglycerate-dependent phosphoglycerate mutase
MQESITRITAIRHGETAWNVDTRIQGFADISLNDKGRWQAGRAGQALKGESIDAIISSDLSRALETARAVAQPHALPVRTDTGLRERGFGIFEGKTFTEIETLWPEEALMWRKRVPEFAPQGGESLIDLQARVITCLRTLAQQHTGQHIVVVAHGGVMDVIYREATGQSLDAPRTWNLTNAAINRVLWNGEGFSLVGWADVAHLDESLRDEQHA